jgi:hypothetical protein
MNHDLNHLTDWQIEELIIEPPAKRIRFIDAGEAAGDLSNQALLHLQTCPACKLRKQNLEETLSLYRNTAVMKAEEAISASESSNLSVAAMRTDSFFDFGFFGRWRAHAVAFLLMLVVLIPACVAHERQRQEAIVPVQKTVVEEHAKDDLLLQQVDQEITESVPQPMQSLTQPVLQEENASQYE